MNEATANDLLDIGPLFFIATVNCGITVNYGHLAKQITADETDISVGLLWLLFISAMI